MFLLITVVYQYSTVEATAFSKDNSSLELIKTTRLESYHLHHVKQLKDTILIISNQEKSSNVIRKLNLNELKSIDFLLLEKDTLFFTYQTQVAGKPYKIKSTTAPMGKNSKVMYSYSRLPILL